MTCRLWPAVPGTALSIALFELACFAPAFADTPLSIQAGPTFVFQQNARNAGGTTEFNFGANYDFGPRLPLPIRASGTFDYMGGSNGGNSLSSTGIGIAGRLTTPLYAGAGIGVYFENAKVCCLAGPGGSGSTSTSTSASGVGSNLFVGEQILGLPGGISLSLQGTYQQRPTFAGIDPSGFNLGLRLQF